MGFSCTIDRVGASEEFRARCDNDKMTAERCRQIVGAPAAERRELD